MAAISSSGQTLTSQTIVSSQASAASAAVRSLPVDAISIIQASAAQPRVTADYPYYHHVQVAVRRFTKQDELLRSTDPTIDSVEKQRIKESPQMIKDMLKDPKYRFSHLDLGDILKRAVEINDKDIVDLVFKQPNSNDIIDLQWYLSDAIKGGKTDIAKIFFNYPTIFKKLDLYLLMSYAVTHNNPTIVECILTSPAFKDFKPVFHSSGYIYDEKSFTTLSTDLAFWDSNPKLKALLLEIMPGILK